jgi:hypothetical protein
MIILVADHPRWDLQLFLDPHSILRLLRHSVPVIQRPERSHRLSLCHILLIFWRSLSPSYRICHVRHLHKRCGSITRLALASWQQNWTSCGILLVSCLRYLCAEFWLILSSFHDQA